MINVADKQPTLRQALAWGKICLTPVVFDRILNQNIPKGNPLTLAEVSGVMAAKLASQTLPLCHPLIIDQVQLAHHLNHNDMSVEIVCLVTCHGKTGVEMEALIGVQSALACIYDLCKMFDHAMRIQDCLLLVKSGGKRGYWNHPDVSIPEWVPHALVPQPRHEPIPQSLKTSLLTVSSSKSTNPKADASGKKLVQALQDHHEICEQAIVYDDSKQIQDQIKQWLSTQQPDLIITTGGTGITPDDFTPDAIEAIADRVIPGIGEYLRINGSRFTRFSWLSRASAYIIDKTVVVCLPGNPKAIDESMPSLMPLLTHACQLAARQPLRDSKQSSLNTPSEKQP